MLELNLSANPQVSYSLITQARNISILTGNNCLNLCFTRNQYQAMLASHLNKVVDFIKIYSTSWFGDNIEYRVIKTGMLLRRLICSNQNSSKTKAGIDP